MNLGSCSFTPSTRSCNSQTSCCMHVYLTRNCRSKSYRPHLRGALNRTLRSLHISKMLQSPISCPKPRQGRYAADGGACYSCLKTSQHAHGDSRSSSRRQRCRIAFRIEDSSMIRDSESNVVTSQRFRRLDCCMAQAHAWDRSADQLAVLLQSQIWRAPDW